MYKAIFGLLLLAAVCQGNEIRNGDFQSGLKHWLHNIKGLKVDPEVKAGNLPAVPIVGPGNIRQDVQLEPDTLYELTFMIKGEKINDASPSDLGARVQLQGGKVWRRVTGDNTGKCLTGSFDWKKIKTQFNTGTFKTGKIRVWMVLNTTGTCWVADFQLNKVESAPAAVK